MHLQRQETCRAHGRKPQAFEKACGGCRFEKKCYILGGALCVCVCVCVNKIINICKLNPLKISSLPKKSMPEKLPGNRVFEQG